jgi:hypothetical protein
VQLDFKGMIFKAVLVSVCCGIAGFEPTHAAGAEQYDYPELSVVPRASDRIHLEAEKEGSRQWVDFIPIQLSAVATLAAGVVSNNSNSPGASYVGIGVGGAWLLTSVVLAASYHPYTSADQAVSVLPKGSIREQLTRERISEEEIQSISAAGERLKWLSVVSNLGTSIYLLSRSDSGIDQSKKNLMKGFQIAAAVASLTPLVFGFHWHDVYVEQKEYKKRIYAPVANATVFVDPSTQKMIPGLVLSMGF